MTLALHAFVSHVTLHVCAEHVMSFAHERYPQWRSQLDPPQLIVPVHSLPPPAAQSILHDDALLQSMSPHDVKPQSISHGMPAGHVVFVMQAPFAVQS